MPHRKGWQSLAPGLQVIKVVRWGAVNPQNTNGRPAVVVATNLWAMMLRKLYKLQYLHMHRRRSDFQRGGRGNKCKSSEGPKWHPAPSPIIGNIFNFHRLMSTFFFTSIAFLSRNPKSFTEYLYIFGL